jgi:hypothetical protein
MARKAHLDETLIDPTAQIILVAGLDQAKIRRAIEAAGLDPGTDAHLTRLIAAAKASILDVAATEGEIGHEVALGRLNTLYAKCVVDKDYRGALEVQKEINRLRPQRVNSETGGAEQADDPAGPFDFKARFRENMRKRQA